MKKMKLVKSSRGAQNTFADWPECFKELVILYTSFNMHPLTNRLQHSIKYYILLTSSDKTHFYHRCVNSRVNVRTNYHPCANTCLPLIIRFMIIHRPPAVFNRFLSPCPRMRLVSLGLGKWFLVVVRTIVVRREGTSRSDDGPETPFGVFADIRLHRFRWWPNALKTALAVLPAKRFPNLKPDETQLLRTCIVAFYCKAWLLRKFQISHPNYPGNFKEWGCCKQH